MDISNSVTLILGSCLSLVVESGDGLGRQADHDMAVTCVLR